MVTVLETWLYHYCCTFRCKIKDCQSKVIWWFEDWRQEWHNFLSNWTKHFFVIYSIELTLPEWSLRTDWRSWICRCHYVSLSCAAFWIAFIIGGEKSEAMTADKRGNSQTKEMGCCFKWGNVFLTAQDIY